MQNVHAMRPEVRADYERALEHVRGDEAFATRLERFFTELRDPLVALYGDDPRFEAQWRALLEAIARTAAGRSGSLRALDHEREITQDWLQREQAVGYVTYVDRFAGTLNGVREHLPYLRELGISYLHLMPLLRARPQPNDGGYAVVDYGAVEPALGTMDDLRALAGELRAAGMALCIDVVLNHTAREHPWAQAALAGDARALGFYRTFADRAEPDAYEQTMPDVFPETAPGSFTWEPALERWVWTTFNAYQWDLDYANPEVFRAMAEAMLELAAAGVDVLRLDAVPFLWKRVGTNSQNQPEVHELLQAFRAADAHRRAGRRLQGRGDRLPARPRRLPRRRAPRGQGVRPRLPQRPHGPGLERARLGPRRAADQRPALDAAGTAGRRLGDLRALPRRHRLGGHRGGRRGRPRGRAPAPALPRRLLRRRLPGRVRARRALPDRPARRRGAHERHGGVARRARGGAGERRRAARRPRHAAHAAAATRSPSPSAACRSIYMGDELGLRNDAGVGGRSGAAATTAGCTGRRWTGRRARAAPPGLGRGTPVGRPAPAGSRAPRHARRPRPGCRRAAVDRQRPRLRAAARTGGRAAAAAGPTSRLTAGPSTVAVVRERGLELTDAAAQPDGRPLVLDGDTLVLEPFQYLWLRD